MKFERKVGRGHGEIVDVWWTAANGLANDATVALAEAKRLLAANWLPLRPDGTAAPRTYAVVTQVGGQKLVDGKTLEEIFGFPAPVSPPASGGLLNRPWAVLAVIIGGLYLLDRK